MRLLSISLFLVLLSCPAFAQTQCTCDTFETLGMGIHDTGKAVIQAAGDNLNRTGSTLLTATYSLLLAHAAHSETMVRRVADSFYYKGLLTIPAARIEAREHQTWLMGSTVPQLEWVEDATLSDLSTGSPSDPTAVRLAYELRDKIRAARHAMIACTPGPER
jgi:hypothetical protein